MRCVNTKESMWKTFYKTTTIHTHSHTMPNVLSATPRNLNSLYICCYCCFVLFYFVLFCSVWLSFIVALLRCLSTMLQSRWRWCCVVFFFHMIFYICRANWLLLVGCAATVTVAAFPTDTHAHTHTSHTRIILLHYYRSLIMKIFVYLHTLAIIWWWILWAAIEKLLSFDLNSTRGKEVGIIFDRFCIIATFRRMIAATVTETQWRRNGLWKSCEVSEMPICTI